MYSRSVCKLTARQYGEPAPPQRGARMRRWLLPDAESGQSPDISPQARPEICHGAGFKLRADARACRVIGCPYL